MLCDGNPDPLNTCELNTYMNLLRDDKEYKSVPVILKESEGTLKVFEIRTQTKLEFQLALGQLAFKFCLSWAIPSLLLKWFSLHRGLLCTSSKWEWKVTCPGGESNCPGWADGTFCKCCRNVANDIFPSHWLNSHSKFFYWVLYWGIKFWILCYQ